MKTSKSTLSKSGNLTEFMQSKKLQDVLAKAKFLQGIERKLQIVLEHELSQHVRVANIHANTLIIETDSAAWSMRMQFTAPKALQALRQNPELTHLTRLECKVRPPASKKPVKYWEKSFPSTQNKQLIADTATIISDPALQKALLKLAEN